ncbi:MAG: cytochrome c [Pseudomonadales bacterium]|nr:cytochrome c [Pseudomonadales bacterium]
MNTFRLFKKAAIASTLILSTTHAIAQSTPETNKPLALQKIMRDMGVNMQRIVDGISREDWKVVEENAALIATHPQPPVSEKTRIFAFFSTDMGKFKGFDGKTHEAAAKLSQTAASENPSAVISDFADLQKSCLACHQSFRKPFISHFYGM